VSENRHRGCLTAPRASEFLSFRYAPLQKFRCIFLSISFLGYFLTAHILTIPPLDIETDNIGSHYMLHKIKVYETAVLFRLVERFMYNEVGFGCGSLFGLIRQ